MGGPVSECSLWRYYSSTFYMATALVIRVSLGVIWWRGAESCSSQMTLLVYMALIVRVASVVLLWEWDGSSVRGSRRQSRFSFSSVVLWWVWELHISGIYQVACSSVVDDDAISHFSTMEWPFGTSLLVYIMALVVGIGVSSAHVAIVEANCSLQTSLLVYMALVVGVSSVVLWWNGASRLVYMALVVRVSSVLLSWKRDGSSTWLLLSESLQLQLCFGGSGTARPLWQYVKSHAPLWLMTLRYHMSLLLNGPFEEQAYCSSRTYYLSTSTWLLNSCRRSLFFSCALMGKAAHSSQHFNSHALTDGIVIAITFSLAIPQVPSSSLAQSARAYYSSTWLLSLEATE
eukprot:scaffold4678_cov85-Skeletonema_dohrnii-CCMP3373.AAC.2